VAMPCGERSPIASATDLISDPFQPVPAMINVREMFRGKNNKTHVP